MGKTKLEQNIQQAECTLIAVHWKKQQVFVKVHELSDLQIQAIGNFSLIKTKNSAPIKDFRAIAENLEIQHNLVKAALVTPSYDAIFKIAKTPLAKDAETRFLMIEKELCKMPIGAERSALEQQAQSLRIMFDILLPNDFTAEIAEYVLGTKRTAIKDVTDEILLNCAKLQSRSGGRPSDYCDDKTLTPFNKRDIDTRAYILFDEYIANQKRGIHK